MSPEVTDSPVAAVQPKAADSSPAAVRLDPALRPRVSIPEFPGVTVPLYPAPWTLEGRGYLFLYRFSKAERQRLGHEAEDSRGLGTVMLVDYASSDVGPYQELLFMPGKLRSPAGWRHRITRIYVSSMESVVNGRINWAIPKNLASFTFADSGSRRGKGGGKSEEVRVESGGREIFRASLASKGPRFPVHTALLPFPLAQPEHGDWITTAFSGKGKGRLADLSEISADAEAFPDLSGIRPLAVLAVEPFRITFPVAGRQHSC